MGEPGKAGEREDSFYSLFPRPIVKQQVERRKLMLCSWRQVQQVPGPKSEFTEMPIHPQSTISEMG